MRRGTARATKRKAAARAGRGARKTRTRAAKRARRGGCDGSAAARAARGRTTRRRGGTTDVGGLDYARVEAALATVRGFDPERVRRAMGNLRAEVAARLGLGDEVQQAILEKLAADVAQIGRNRASSDATIERDMRMALDIFPYHEETDRENEFHDHSGSESGSGSDSESDYEFDGGGRAPRRRTARRALQRGGLGFAELRRVLAMAPVPALTPIQIRRLEHYFLTAHRTQDHIYEALQQTHVDRLVSYVKDIQKRHYEIPDNEHNLTQNDVKHMLIDALFTKNFNADDDTDGEDDEEDEAFYLENDKDLLEKILDVVDA